MTTIPQEVIGPLARVPDEILKLMLITLPYQDILGKCATSKQYARICRDRTFWADKAKQDYGVSTQIFLSKQGNPSQLYQEYLITDEVTKFLTEVFDYGMFLRGWSGQGPYPQQFTAPDHIPTMLERYHKVIKAYENSLTSVKNMIDDIRIVDTISQEQGIFTIPDYKQTDPGNWDMRLMTQLFTNYPVIPQSAQQRRSNSFILIATAVANADKYGKTIGNFTLSDLHALLQTIVGVGVGEILAIPHGLVQLPQVQQVQQIWQGLGFGGVQLPQPYIPTQLPQQP